MRMTKRKIKKLKLNYIKQKKKKRFKIYKKKEDNVLNLPGLIVQWWLKVLQLDYNKQAMFPIKLDASVLKVVSYNYKDKYLKNINKEI